ncbi:MAG TPA: serine hydrolase [Anaerolineaceae bacterium]
MKSKSIFPALRWVSVLLVFAAVLVTVIQLVAYSRIRSYFLPGTVIAGVPVGNLDQKAAAERLQQAYSVPVEVRYKNAVIQIKPAVVGFQLQLDSMMAAAGLERLSQPFWEGFWDYLWNRLPAPKEVPLLATLSTERLATFLRDEVAPRYDTPPVASMPVPGSTQFQKGEPGTVLDVDRAVILISDALRSPTSRVVNLTYGRIEASRPSFQNLQIMLKQIVETAKFDGIIELYMDDLQSGQEIHFAYRNLQPVPTDIAFTAASTMKIPIMVSTFRRMGEPADKNIVNLIELMIERSENDPADKLMETMEKKLGPLEVTKDMQALGLQNTFIAGYFAPGSQLLSRVQTTANKRKDVLADPDVYNQTVPAEIGMLLEDIYLCAETGGGTLVAVFPGQITQSECRDMVQYLTRNKIAVLLQAGLPEGTQIAHKHGWIIEVDGLMHTIADAGIVYTPGGNFIISVYLYNKNQLLWEPANLMVANLASAIYNYYNLPVDR